MLGAVWYTTSPAIIIFRNSSGWYNIFVCTHNHNLYYPYTTPKSKILDLMVLLRSNISSYTTPCHKHRVWKIGQSGPRLHYVPLRRSMPKIAFHEMDFFMTVLQNSAAKSDTFSSSRGGGWRSHFTRYWGSVLTKVYLIDIQTKDQESRDVHQIGTQQS